MFPDYPHCPKCQGVLPIRRLFKEAPTERSGLLVGDGSDAVGLFTVGNTGIVCTHCGAKLRVLQKGVLIAKLLTMLIGFPILVVPFVLIMETLERAHDTGWLVLLLLPPIVAGVMLFERLPPRFARLRPLADGEHAAFPLSENRESDAA
jgi:hypothetical protein